MSQFCVQYSDLSFWLESAGDDLTPRLSLRGTHEADVAILGGGFTGLWTAYYLLRRNPALRVVILEKEIAGFGASGRNGGWCTSGFPASPAHLHQLFGRDTARDVQVAMYETVDEVGRILLEEEIDAHFRKGGELLIARGAHQVAAVEQEHAALAALGLADKAQILDEVATTARLGVTDARCALFTPACAAIHPGRLVRGLARAVERRGGLILEQTAVTAFTTGRRPSLITPHGSVRARTIVLAGEAYLSQLHALHRQVLPVYSLIVLTEPLSAAQWEAIGWHGHECVASMRYTVDYLSRTADGRILFGGRGAPYHYGSRIKAAHDQHAPTHAMLRAMLVRWFPILKGIRFTHAWGGPLGIPRDWLPTMTYDPAQGVALAFGYTGQGVATSNLSGRVLADLIQGVSSPLTCLPMARHRPQTWEPEPLRWLGVRFVQQGLFRVDRRAERTSRPPTGRTLAERLGSH
jgi:glycine/D-amino acid oxidase-like deaminating enzyme